MGGNADQASYSRPVTAFRDRSVGPRCPEAAEKSHLVNGILQRGLLTTPCIGSEYELPNFLSTFVTSPYRSQSFALSVHDIFAPVRRPLHGFTRLRATKLNVAKHMNCAAGQIRNARFCRRSRCPLLI